MVTAKTALKMEDKVGKPAVVVTTAVLAKSCATEVQFIEEAGKPLSWSLPKRPTEGKRHSTSGLLVSE